MISHHFDYRAPDTLDEALAILVSGEEVAVLGGGTWLVPNMTHGLQQPSTVLDIKRLNLGGVRESGGDIVIGAGATYRQILSSPLVAAHAPLLHEMAGGITGGTQITGRGTLGGSACYANPASDVPACLCALRATLRLASQPGTREVEASAFYVGAFETCLEPDEMLVEIVVPKMGQWRSSGYEKLKFSYGSWPIITASCLSRGVDQGLRKHRIAVGAANVVPIVFETEVPFHLSEGDLARLGAQVAALITDEWSDELAEPGYRRRVAASVVVKAVRKSMGTC